MVERKTIEVKPETITVKTGNLEIRIPGENKPGIITLNGEEIDVIRFTLIHDFVHNGASLFRADIYTHHPE